VVEELVLAEGVPAIAACRYKDPGLEKRSQWEQTWDLQRAEDRGEAPGEIPVPPKYASKDFARPEYWKHRGKLDVPKETFRLYPGCGPQGQPMVGWAGWDWLQQAQSLVVLYQKRREDDGWDRTQLMPILVALAEVIPWVRQWYDGPEHDRAGSQYAAFLSEELRIHGLTADDLRAWRPEARARGRKAAKKPRRKAAEKSSAKPTPPATEEP
jgi:hypothetical protein